MGKTNSDIWTNQGSTTKTVADDTRIVRYDPASNVFYLSTGAAVKTYLDSQGYMNESDFTDNESLQWKNESGTVENKLFEDIGTIYPKGYYSFVGFSYTYTGGNHRITLQSKLYCKDSSGGYNIYIASNWQKHINLSYVYGNLNGTLDTGSFSSNRLYYIWAIYDSSGGVSDILTSLDNSSPTMPSGFNYKKLIGAIWTIDYVTEETIQYYSHELDSDNIILPRIPANYIESQASISISGTDILFDNIHAMDSTNVYEMYMPQEMTKGFSAVFSAGDSNGMLDTGLIADDTLYYLSIILNPSTGAIDFLMSTSAASPTMPSGYTMNRIIGYLLTADYSGNSEIWVWKPGETPYFEMDGTTATRDFTLPRVNTYIDKFRYIIKCLNITNACTLISADGFDSSISSPITMAADEVIEVLASNEDSEYKVIQKGILGDFRNVTTVNTATYDILPIDSILHVAYTITGAVTSLTLMTSETIRNRIITINDGGNNSTTNNITIDTEASQTIDGAATYVISTNGDSVSLYCDGINWYSF